MVTSPPSPTKQAVPHVRVPRTATNRPSAVPDVSSVISAPAPCVSALIGRDRIVGRRIDQGLGAEFFGARQPLGADVERDDAGAHRRGELRRREADRPLADHGDGVAAGKLHAPQRLIGGAGAA